MTSKTTALSRDQQFAVVWPLGRFASPPIQPGPPVSDLKGKTIGEIWNYRFRGDDMFPIIRESMRRRFPDIKFVEFPVFGDVHGPKEREVVAALPELLRQHGCDAVVVGVAS